VAFPIATDKLDEARRWGQEKMGPRRAELAESNQRIGLTRESWHLQQMPNGDRVLRALEK
jgi:hypothetical protein